MKGGDQDNSVTLRLAADNPQVVQGDVGADGTPQFSFARTSIAAIDLKGGAGDGVLKIDDANGAFTATDSGGDGNDSLEGGQIKVATENDRYRGGAGNDLVDGGKGTDTALLGSGDDTFRWDSGEGSVQGDDGYDTLVFNGAGINEQATLLANDWRLAFLRTQGNVLMDTGGVERVDDNVAGGAGSVTVDDLSSTDVRQTNLDLGGTDGALDSVLVNATEGDDNIAIDGFPTRVDVSGLANLVSIRRAEPTDALPVDTRAGTDHVVTNNIAGLLQVAVDGVAGVAMTRGWSIGSLADLRARLSELEAERIFARSYGMAADAAYMTDLEDEVAEVTAVYFGAAVTEVATLRGELFGPKLG